MGFVYSLLHRLACEEQEQFDNRVARMLPFAAGKVYFDLRNYDVHTGEFNVYIAWDEEVNEYLAYSLPEGGYFVKATMTQAEDLHEIGDGVPVYMKLTSVNGQLYPYRTYVIFNGRPFSVEFGGGDLIPVDDRFQLHSPKRKSGASQNQTGSQRGVLGSSQRRTGSQRGILGSSQRRTGSQRGALGSSQRRTGSQRGMLGSSQRRTGSQRGTLGSSQRHVEWKNPMGDVRVVVDRDSNDISNELMLEFPQEWQLINRQRRPSRRVGGNARFGYGLDLIWDTEDL